LTTRARVIECWCRGVSRIAHHEILARPTDDVRQRRCGSRLAAGFTSSVGALGLLYKSDRYYLPPGRCVSKHSIRARRRLLTNERTVNAYPPLMLGNCPRHTCLAHCVVQAMPTSGRAGPSRDGCPVRRRNARGRLARAASLLHVRQPADRHDCHRQ
jgi:hypothetical protein